MQRLVLAILLLALIVAAIAFLARMFGGTRVASGVTEGGSGFMQRIAFALLVLLTLYVAATGGV